MSRLLNHLLACAAALSLAVATAWGAVEINDLQVTNVGTTTFTVLWTTSEVSTPALEVFSDSGGTNAVTATLGLAYYPIAEGDPAVVNETGARAGRRALELLAINRRVVVVRVTGLSPGTAYYVRPRTFSAGGADNGVGPVALRQVTTALFTSLVVDGRLLRVRFPGFSGEGMIALIQGPAGTTPLSTMVGDSTEADSAVVPLAGLINTTSGTNALFDTSQQIVIRVLGAGAPTGTFTRTIDFTAGFKTAQLETLVSDLATPAPNFTTQPVSLTVLGGAAATFTATATGTPLPTYQWQRQPAAGGGWSNLVNGASYSGVTTATLSLFGATLAMSGDQFRCVATNGVPSDATSNPATLTVTGTAPLAITSGAVLPGGALGLPYTFTVVAISTPAPTFSATGLPAGLAIDSATGIISGTPTVTGSFTPVITASNGVNPNAVQNAALTIAINVQTITFAALANQTFGDAGFVVSATSSSGLPVSVNVVSGPAIITSGTVTLTGAGTVTLRASQVGDGTYAPAAVVERSFTVAKAPLTAKADNLVRLVGLANPALTISYAGFVPGDTVAVIDTLPTATTSATPASPAGSYPIVLTGGSDNNYALTLVAGTLTVAMFPVITAHPVAEFAMAGGSAAFMVAATNPGAGVLAYRWYFTPPGSATPQALSDLAGRFAGAQTATLTVANIQASDTGDYVCVVSNSDGLATSNAAPLSVVSRLVRVASRTAIPGAQVVVPIQLLAAGDENTVSFGLQFDPAKLTFVSHALGADVAGGTITPKVSQQDTGLLGFVIGKAPSTVHAAGARTLITLTFTVAADVLAEEVMPLAFVEQPSLRQILATNGAQLPGPFVDGRVTAVVGLEGDINGDGEVDGGDWVKLGRIVVGLDPVPVAGATFMRADSAPRATKGDGTFDGGDWVQLGRYVVGLDALQPAGGPAAPIP